MSDHSTPESVAYQLMKDIFAAEAATTRALPDRAAILATFIECLGVVKPEIAKLQPTHGRSSF